MSLRIIGITGRAGSGKDTLANTMESEGFQRYSMAEPIKRGIEAMFGFNRDIWEDRDVKETDLDWLGRSPRYLAQTLGTEWGRDTVHSDLWLLLASKKLAECNQIIIPDIRFVNEAKWVVDNGGKVFEVVRPGEDAIPECNHASENGIPLEYISTYILNNGSVDDFMLRGKRILCSYLYS